MFGFVQVHISLYEDFDIEFNSLSEDHQDFAPEDETHNASEIHSFCLFGGHVFRFLSRKFLSFFGPTSSQTKQMRFWEGIGCDLPLLWNAESHKEKYFFVTIKLSFD